MGIPLTPDDVAKTILFLSCDDSSGVTGTTLVIDAGYLTAAEWDSGKTSKRQHPTSREIISNNLQTPQSNYRASSWSLALGL